MTRVYSPINCPKGLDPDFNGRRKVCRNCDRPIMFVRRSHRNKAHWQHVPDSLTQYRSWRLGTRGSPR